MLWLGGPFSLVIGRFIASIARDLVARVCFAIVLVVQIGGFGFCTRIRILGDFVPSGDSYIAVSTATDFVRRRTLTWWKTLASVGVCVRRHTGPSR